MNYTCKIPSPVGTLTLYGDETNLTGVWLESSRYYPKDLNTLHTEIQDKDSALFTKTRQWLDRYFSGAKPEIKELPLAPQGTPFRHGVWQILCEIPYGEVTTYGEIAKQIARQKGMHRMAPQAVGGAVGHNPISIIIPCHRVVGTNGSLVGYGGGIQKKIQLLRLEKVDVEQFHIPATDINSLTQ